MSGHESWKRRLFELFPELRKYAENKDVIEFKYTKPSIRKYDNEKGIKYTIWFKWVVFLKPYMVKLNVHEISDGDFFTYELTQVLLNGFKIPLSDSAEFLPWTPSLIQSWIHEKFGQN